MKKKILFICAGVLSVSLPAAGTPLDSYSFKSADSTDGGSALRLLSVAGAPAVAGPTLDSHRGSKKTAGAHALSHVSPGMRISRELITEAMTAPSYRDPAHSVGPGKSPGSGGDGDARVLISEPPIAWLLLAGLIGLLRRR